MTTTTAAGRSAVPSRLRIALILGALIALGPLTIDTYLPALPAVGRDLGASETTVQLTLTGTLIGLALGQILIGPLSDAWGRRRPLIAGAALHVLASAAVFIAPSIEVLGVLRVLQGVGASAGAVVGLAIVRDLFVGRAAATMLSRLILVMGAFPVIAPTLGGLLLNWVNWRGVFLFLAAYGLLMLVVVTMGLPETLPAHRRRSARFGPTMRTYGSLLKDRPFVGLVLVAGLAMAALFSYVSGAAFVYQQQFGMSQQVFGLFFGAGAIWLVVATQLNPLLLRWFEPRQIMTVAMIAGVGVGVVGVLLATLGIGGLAGVVGPVWALLLCCGFVLPNAPALALARHGEAAGTASALLGSLQFGIGAVTSPVVGLLGNDARAMALSMAGAMVLGLIALVAVVRPWQLPDINDDELTEDVHSGDAHDDERHGAPARA